MNSKILKPEVRTFGALEIKNCTGGEIDWEKIIPAVGEDTPTEVLYKLSSKDLREEMERCKEELSKLPKQYTIINGVLKRDIPLEGKTLELRNRIFIGYKILNRRNYHRHKIVFSEDVKYEISSMSRSETNSYEMMKGDKVVKNKIHVGYRDRNGEYHPKAITKDCIVPYTREGVIKKKDLILLHKSGRLAIRLPNGRIVSSNYHGIKEDEENLQKLFQGVIEDGREFFVILPKGGFKKKEYGDVPMPWTRYSIRHNNCVPLNQIVRKVYKPEIDGINPKAKEIINEYRGPSKGYAPIYTYDEKEFMRDFVPNLLSFNQVEYGEKCIIVLGTKDIIKHIDGRIKSANKVRNGFHNFTKQDVEMYTGQISRCKDKRIISSEDGVQVFGLSLKGTPEENLKGYLRRFDSVPQKNQNEEAKELLEIAEEVEKLLETADEQDGRQTRFNIEHDLRSELKHLKTRSSKELYYLFLQVEDEIGGAPSKKEQALLNVLTSFKLSRDIHEDEGHGLTSDIEDLVTIENNADDSSYKKSKNLYSQTMGILNRNQNPLNMEGGFNLWRPWEMKGGPISLPTNKRVPKRNIPFVHRGRVARKIKIRNDGMFPITLVKTVRTEEGEKGDILYHEGYKVEREPLFFSSSENKGNVERGLILLEKEFEKCVRLSKRKPYFKLDIKEYFAYLAKELEKDEEASKEYWKQYISEAISPDVEKSSPKIRVTNFPVKFTKGVFKRPIQYRPGTMYPRMIIAVTPITGRRVLLMKRGRKSQLEKFVSNGYKVPTARLFDDRNNPGTVWKQMTWEQYKASEQLPYQAGGKVIFKESGEEIEMEDGSIIKPGEYVRISHTSPSSFKILHTVGDGKGNVDYYIINVNGQVLYAKGDLNLLHKAIVRKESISFTGTRNPTDLTKKFAKAVVTNFLKEDDYVTISGGAEGCDTIVHTTTMKKNGKTIIVLAGGFDGQYTKKNQVKPKTVLKTGGLLLSEHPPEYRPSAKDFVLRNKIIASLSDRLVVFEAGKGTKHCAKFGVELGKELLVQTNSGYKVNLVSRRDYPF